MYIHNFRIRIAYFLILLAFILFFFLSKESIGQQTQNNPERVEWFHKLGYGLFIHFGVDVQIGTVISHSLVGASDEYIQKYFTELPKTFNPRKFDAKALAREAKVDGIKYVVFTAKHHSGFCMFDSKTTDFKITKTPYNRDMTREVIDAFRDQGIAIGIYFSPDDFNFLYKNKITIDREYLNQPAEKISKLIEFDKRQLGELLNNYGRIDILFIDGPNNDIDIMKELADFAWQQNPGLIITRGAMSTPEISPSTEELLPNEQDLEVWEACFTMGTSWQYKPTNEKYLSGTQLINDLIRIRALNGNMLLNIGPKPDGGISLRQLNILREIGTWLFINGESIYDVAPFPIKRQKNLWFTKSNKDNSLFIHVTNENWEWGTPKTFLVESIQSNEKTEVSVLGQNDKVLEYYPKIIPQTQWENTDWGLFIRAYRTQRIYNDRMWPNPSVLKVKNFDFSN